MNSWGRAKILAKDRDKWSPHIRALCATGHAKDR